MKLVHNQSPSSMQPKSKLQLLVIYNSLAINPWIPSQIPNSLGDSKPRNSKYDQWISANASTRFD